MAHPAGVLPTFMETEPVTSIAVGFSLLFNSTLVGLTAFGIIFTWEQMVALATMFNTALALATLWQRSKVTPVDKANDRIIEATSMPPGATPPVIQ